MRSKLDALARSSDYVVIDSPPLLPVSDSVIISSLADITLLVVTARTTARRSLLRSIEMLRQVDAPLEGLVFNGVHSEGTYGYGYGYGYKAYGTYSAYAPSGSGNTPGSGKGRKARRSSSSTNGTGPEVNGHSAPSTNGATGSSAKPVTSDH